MVVFSDPTAEVSKGRHAASLSAGHWDAVRRFPNPPSVDPRIDRVAALMHVTLHRKLPLSELAGAAGLSISRLSHLFHTQTGISPRRYLKAARLARAKELLDTSHLSVKEVAARSGFNHVGRFIGEFRNTYGLTPSQHRQKVQRSKMTLDEGSRTIAVR
ncbi:MAG: helix-turn-helix domain-containing protein [Terriglobia bacterium]